MTAFVQGEFHRTLDDRYRLSIPQELAAFTPTGPATLVKERPGALSLWHKEDWRKRLDQDVQVVQSKLTAGHLHQRLNEVQLLGRLLSTRHCQVNIAGRGRLTLPEGFREFLGVEQGGTIVLVGAALCVELWHPQAWLDHLNEQIPHFQQLLDGLVQ